jgi:release factor glutamine methyltransferase
VADAANRLTGAGMPADEAARDAALLARWTLGWDEARWIAHNRESAPAGFGDTLGTLVARRAAREPIGYLTGVREFYGRAFLVTPAVLIPRPETELLVEDVLEAAASIPRARVCDVGTGSGCIAITVALERPDAVVAATDASDAALSVARGNAVTLGATRVQFVTADLFADEGPYDVIASNPPYVAEVDRASLDADVRDYEPASALFGGPDGLDVIRRLIPAAAARLAPGGWLFVEIGAGQAEAVAALVDAAPALTRNGFRRDWQEIPRVLRAQRTEGVPEGARRTEGVPG